MIKSLSKIRNISVIDQNLTNNLYSFSELKFDENEVGSGGFGSVHKIQSIDGVNSEEFLLKIFRNEEKKDHAYDVVHLLHEKLKHRQLQTGLPIFHEFPELLGLPFLAFKGYDGLSERECIGFIMYDLGNLGFEFLGNDNIKSGDYQSLEIQEKFLLAYQLAKVIDFLHDIEFIHSDINEHSIFIDSKRIQLAIIDFDSGYHYDKQDKPSTLGKLSHWISGKYRKLVSGGDASELTVEDRIREENWLLANGLFEVLFGLIPYFFLNDADHLTKKKYLKNYTWPEADTPYSLVNPSSVAILQNLNQAFEYLKEEGAGDLIRGFKVVFNEGYEKEKKRLSANEWKDILFEINKELNNSPDILEFISNKKCITRKDEAVEFFWEALKFQIIFLNGKLIDINKKSGIIKLQDTSEVDIIIRNDFGEHRKNIKISAKKVDPKIIKFISSKEVRTDLSPLELFWKTQHTSKVYISSIKAPQSSSGSIEINPTEKSFYVLKAVGHFDQIAEKIITIKVVKPTITKFTYEINLNEGIDNIDLHWETENATNATITPKVGIVSKNGVAHVRIHQETEFKLMVSGYFGEVTRTINAFPFPAPVINQILVETPRIQLESYFDTEALNFPFSNWNLVNIDASNVIKFEKDAIIEPELTNELIPPTFENENSLLEKYVKENVTFNDIYNRIKEKIYTRIR